MFVRLKIDAKGIKCDQIASFIRFTMLAGNKMQQVYCGQTLWRVYRSQHELPFRLKLTCTAKSSVFQTRPTVHWHIGFPKSRKFKVEARLLQAAHGG